jgi:hypothetical protein
VGQDGILRRIGNPPVPRNIRKLDLHEKKWRSGIESERQLGDGSLRKTMPKMLIRSDLC